MSIFNSLKIIIEKTGEEIKVFDDLGLYLINNDYIGDPVPITNYVTVMGRDGLIDLTEAVTGRTIFSHRPLKIELGSNRPKGLWVGIISSLRNKLDGKMCKFIFDDDRNYYWRGRVHIVDFALSISIGTFTIDVPEAEPYKYSLEASSEPWLWDPFDFETGIITYVGSVAVDGQYTWDVPAGYMAVTPEIVVSNLISTDFTVDFKGITYKLKKGTNRIPPILINGDEATQLIFRGKADVNVVYRSGSL